LIVAGSLFVDGAFWRLRKLLIGGVGHISSKLDQDCLHCVVSGPVGKAGQLGRIDRSISRVDAGEVDFSNELDKGWLVRVLITAVHLEAVDSVLVDAVWGA